MHPRDAAAFQAYRSIPEFGRYQGGSPMSETEAVAFLAQMNRAPFFAAGEWVQLGIAEPDSDVLLGDIGLHVSEDGRTGEVGLATPSSPSPDPTRADRPGRQPASRRRDGRRDRRAAILQVHPRRRRRPATRVRRTDLRARARTTAAST